MAAKFPDVLEDADPDLGMTSFVLISLHIQYLGNHENRVVLILILSFKLVSGDISLKSNQQAISAKQILEECGLSVEEIETIASKYSINIYQAAEKAEQFAKMGLSPELIFAHLMENSNPAQKKVQKLITSAVSGKGSGENVADVGSSQSQTGDMEAAQSFVSQSSTPATCGDSVMPDNPSFPSKYHN